MASPVRSRVVLQREALSVVILLTGGPIFHIRPGRLLTQTDYDSLVNALVQENIYYQQLLAEQQEQLYATASYQAIHCSPFWSGPEHNWQSGSTYGNYFCSPGAFWQVDQQDFFQNEEWAY
ncbi:hypothetical protein TGDOM2_293010 [Toxoplasma gondii GAB2-2007-GAL-DOM2]|uniref:Uncharacterized protein n=2 Tax=Toxoplasma gondii TaxID=5811 RepID=A0A086KSA7_TOXGO|nr:hypothetical protein TGDOM2_293010 [Toxoplasma gondii GAB2-2007-GAL-DOM2]KFG47275.1 hypothetical protein TGFOU_293010 [Toxoplasma gondii FOU]